MTRFLKVGEGNRLDGRIVEAVTTHNTMLPPLSLSGRTTRLLKIKGRVQREGLLSAQMKVLMLEFLT